MEPVETEITLNISPKKTVTELMMDTEAICRVFDEAGKRVRAKAKHDGRKIPMWRDERVVWLAPEELDAETEERNGKL